VPLNTRKWLRFVHGERFHEIVVDDATVHVRKGTCQSDAKMERSSFESAEAAQAHVCELLAKLRKRGWEDDGTIQRPLPPEPPSDDVRHAARRRVREAWSDALSPLRNAYAKALTEAGLAADRSFFAQAGPDSDADELARRCLRIAETAYSVEFARAHFDDEEHGTGGWPLPDDEFARFYESPSRVAQIAEKRFAGRLTEDDGRYPSGPRRRAR